MGRRARPALMQSSPAGLRLWLEPGESRREAGLPHTSRGSHTAHVLSRRGQLSGAQATGRDRKAPTHEPWASVGCVDVSEPLASRPGGRKTSPHKPEFCIRAKWRLLGGL